MEIWSLEDAKSFVDNDAVHNGTVKAFDALKYADLLVTILDRKPEAEIHGRAAVEYAVRVATALISIKAVMRDISERHRIPKRLVKELFALKDALGLLLPPGDATLRLRFRPRPLPRHRPGALRFVKPVRSRPMAPELDAVRERIRATTVKLRCSTYVTKRLYNILHSVMLDIRDLLKRRVFIRRTPAV